MFEQSRRRESSGPMVVSLAVLGLCAAGLRAQVPIQEFQGSATLEGYGAVVCAAGDVDGDGYADVAISAPERGGPGPGRIEIRSGRDGSLLHELFGATPGAEYGRHMAPLADIDGDGQQELIVSEGAGKFVDVLSGKTFALLRHFQVPPGAVRVGWGLADLGDLDADGTHDFSIGGSLGDAVGFVAIVSGANSQLLLLKQGSGPGDVFGSDVAAAGDVNGDSHPDFLVRRNQADIYFAGHVSLFSGKDGSELAHFGGDSVGASMGAVGDVDGDGCDEIILGAPQLLSPHIQGPGYAFIWSWKQHAPLFEFDGVQMSSQMGACVGGLGDVNADGVADVFVTCPAYAPASGVGHGKAFVYSGSDGALLFSVEGTGDEALGGVAAAAGDVNGDGRCDLLVGAPGGTVLPPSGHSGSVAVHVISPPFLYLGQALAGTWAAPILTGSGTLQPQTAATFGLDGALPGSSAVLIAGFAPLYAPFKGGTLVPTADLVTPPLTVGPDGQAQLGVHWPARLPAGTPVYLQMWVADAGGPWGFAASNALQAVTP